MGQIYDWLEPVMKEIPLSKWTQDKGRIRKRERLRPYHSLSSWLQSSASLVNSKLSSVISPYRAVRNLCTPKGIRSSSIITSTRLYSFSFTCLKWASMYTFIFSCVWVEVLVIRAGNPPPLAGGGFPALDFDVGHDAVIFIQADDFAVGHPL